jgi:tetratricopeptide (TPR) repeat protein
MEERMNTDSEPIGSVETALTHARRLLQSDPLLAAEQAREILKVAPQHPMAVLVLGSARRMSADAVGALQILRPLVASQPNWAAAHYELGLALAETEQADAALAAMRRAVALRPNMPDAWRAIGDRLFLSGDAEGADAAYAQHIRASTQDPRLLVAASALVEGRIAQAEALLRAHLKQYPTDVVAIRMLAEVAARLGHNGDAELLLESCLELAPSFHAARHQYAIVLQRQNKAAAALRQIDRLAKFDPLNPSYRNLKAVVLVKIGEYRESIEIYAEVLTSHPENSKIWLSYGHALNTAGRDRESIAAYRRSIELAPHFGEAYWSLANLKTFRFNAEETQAMRTQLARGDLTEEDRLHFDFAMGKALEDDGDYADSFRHYSSGNELRRSRLGYDADEMSAFVRQSIELFSAEFFDARLGYGAQAPDPIFIVGLPRAGSTLIEQILASHSSVEGTMELTDILAMAGNLAGKRKKSDAPKYPGVLATLSAETCRELGESYIRETRIQRKTAKPLFIDKMPNNFLHIGLIQLVLPNAKIIDARRHPIACCFSAFKQQFADGHRYAYSLEDVGRFYRDYVELMDHFDRVIPGKVHRVIYENMIEDTETEVRRLLSYCGLSFEAACLRFYENDRPVRTPSSQQVRRPIYREGVEHWRHYESWLGPLKEALREVVDLYPDTRQSVTRRF